MRSNLNPIFLSHLRCDPITHQNIHRLLIFNLDLNRHTNANRIGQFINTHKVYVSQTLDSDSYKSRINAAILSA